MLGLNETMDQLDIANSVRWYGHVLRREDSHVLKRSLDFEVKGRKGGRRGHGKGKVSFRRKDAICVQSGVSA